MDSLPLLIRFSSTLLGCNAVCMWIIQILRTDTSTGMKCVHVAVLIK